MKNGSMFGLLRTITSQEKYDENPYFWVFTPSYIYQYRIFSCSVVSKVGDPYTTRFTKANFESFLKKCQSMSEIDSHGVELNSDSRIATLSTCTGDESTRFITQGVLEQVYIAK